MNVLVVLLLILLGLVLWLRSRYRVENFAADLAGGTTSNTAGRLPSTTGTGGDAIEEPVAPPGPPLPVSPCGQTAGQQSYQSIACALYNRLKAAYDKVPSAADKQALIDLYIAKKPAMSGTQYIDTYKNILIKFLDFDIYVKDTFKRLREPVPATYTFETPNAISLADYAPGISTWAPASTSPVSYKCIAYAADELQAISQLDSINVGTAQLNETYKLNAKRNLCVSKGYFYNDGTFGAQGCDVECNGCCMPSSDPVPARGGTDVSGADVSGADMNDENTGGAQVCPKPIVRPFRIPHRELRIRVVPPSLKATTECFTSQLNRDIQQTMKSEKFKHLQQFPLLPLIT
jgi:hypothetical protein